MKPIAAAFLFFILPSQILAQSVSLDEFTLAQELGTLLGSEEPCALSYDQDAISTWIDANVDAASMSFAGTLSMMTDAAAFSIVDMSESSRTAHCRSVERAAVHAGFIE